MAQGGLISVDVGKLAGALLSKLPSPDDRQRLLGSIAVAALANWKNLALRELRSSSRDYVQGLSLDVRKDKAVITLGGELPNLVENGFAGGDMRRWMLSGPKAKQGANGRYLVVPFRHGSPGTTGRNVGPVMPVSIHDAAKKLAPSLSRPKGGVSYGERLSTRSRGVGEQAKQVLESRSKPWHASSIYAGMIRQQKQYGKAKQSSYSTFRVISESVVRGRVSDSGEALEHWRHPGIVAKRFAPRVADFVRLTAASMLSGATGGRP